MPRGLVRYHESGQSHFVTFSCYRRKAKFADGRLYNLFPVVLEEMRIRFGMRVYGYVVMPEHVHLLISEPLVGNPSKVIQAVKLSLSRRLATKGEFAGQFWQRRFYDFNLWGQRKEVEKPGAPFLASFARSGVFGERGAGTDGPRIGCDDASNFVADAKPAPSDSAAARLSPARKR